MLLLSYSNILAFLSAACAFMRAAERKATRIQVHLKTELFKVQPVYLLKQHFTQMFVCITFSLISIFHMYCIPPLLHVLYIYIIAYTHSSVKYFFFLCQCSANSSSFTNMIRPKLQELLQHYGNG